MYLRGAGVSSVRRIGQTGGACAAITREAACSAVGDVIVGFACSTAIAGCMCGLK